LPYGLPRFAGKLQIEASAKQQKTIRRNSAPSVLFGGKAFSPKFAEVTERRRKKHFGRMIYRQHHFKSFCHEIILPKKLSEFFSELEKLIA
jgi:hypothetical protein